MKWIKQDDRYRLVWEGHPSPSIAETDGAIRRLKLMQESYFPCINCGTKGVCRVQGVACEDCLNTPKYKKILAEAPKGVMYKEFKDVVAFGTENGTGRPIAIDTKGKRVSPDDTIYAKTKLDPHGWKTVGKKVAKTNVIGDPDWYERKHG